MDKIRIDPEELLLLKNRMNNVRTKIDGISYGGFVTAHLFSQSRGSSVDRIEECLNTLIKCTNELNTVTVKSITYIGEIVAGFTETDQYRAGKISGEQSTGF